MATFRAVLGTNFNTTTGTHTVTATPQVGDLIVVIGANTGTSNGAVSDNNADGLGGTSAYEFALTNPVKNGSADHMTVRVRNAFIGSATSTIFTYTGGGSTGGGLTVIAISGMTRKGVGTAAAVRSTGKQDNQGAATPAPVLSLTPLTENMIIAAVFNATNPATMTPPASHTERADVGWASPDSGIETATRDNGQTNATITWGSASASAFCSVAIELDSSATLPVYMAKYRQHWN